MLPIYSIVESNLTIVTKKKSRMSWERDMACCTSSYMLTLNLYSITSCPCALRHDPSRSHGHEYSRRSAHLRHHYKFYHVLQRRGGVLTGFEYLVLRVGAGFLYVRMNLTLYMYSQHPSLFHLTSVPERDLLFLYPVCSYKQKIRSHTEQADLIAAPTFNK